MSCGLSAGQVPVRDSAARYFSSEAKLEVLQIDPRRVPALIREDPSPRGPMPHVYGPIPAEAVRAR